MIAKPIKRSELGALNGASQILGCHYGREPLADVLRGKTSSWWWHSCMASDMATPLYVPCILFFTWVDIGMWNTIAAYQNAQANSSKMELDVAIKGILIHNIIFLNDKYPSDDEPNLYFNTEDNIKIGTQLGTFNTTLKGYFDLSKCLYYYRL